MAAKARATGLGVGLVAGMLLASPALAQVSSPASVSNAGPTADQIDAFSRSVGINGTCTRSYLAANKNTFPQSLSALSQFMVLAPAADLCSPGAVASAQNNTPAPADAQITAYSQSVGVNQTCIKAFVLHGNSLPQSLSELNQFQLAAPMTDLCTQAAVSAAASPAPLR